MAVSTTRTVIIGTRTSKLARWQAEHVARRLKHAWSGLSCQIQPFVTKGDKALDKPLPEIGGKGLFTAELEQALREGRIDLAVHSLKDLPVEAAPGLTIGAIVAREDVSDGLITGSGCPLAELPPGAVVGTSSLRRQAQLLAVRPDLQVKSIRGNVDTRIQKVRDGEYDAVVLAAAGLRRIGLEGAVAEWLPLSIMLPAPGQGALAIQCRSDDEITLELLAAIEDESLRRTTTAERHFLEVLGGGCSAPIAAYARVEEDGALHMDGLIANPDGGQVIRVTGHSRDSEELAAQLAGEARRRGATAILAKLSSPAVTGQALAQKRIVVTRAEPQAPDLADRLAELGAEPVLLPTIRIAPMPNTTALDNAIHSLRRYDWVVFTSVNGVAAFWERMEALEKHVTIFNGVRVAAIGPATGDALIEHGVKPDFIPDEFVAEKIAEGLGNVNGRAILLPRAEQARATLADMLGEQGAYVNEIGTYRTLRTTPDDETLSQLQAVDVLTFTSSSTVRNFVEIVGGESEAQRLAAGAHVACIGPITAGTARELGIEVDVVAETYTIEGLLEALIKFFDEAA